MAGPSVAERLHVAGLLAGHSLARVRQCLLAPWHLAANLAAQVPQRLVIAPQDIRTTDPTIANDIYSGYFSFDGKVVDTHGQSPFSIVAPSPAWAEALMSFSWMRHLRAARSALSRENARALVSDWMTIAGRPGGGPAWEPRVVARRILSWLSQSPLILEGADLVFYHRFLKSLARQAAFLRRALITSPLDETLLLGAIALAELGLCTEGMPQLAKKGTQLLTEELRRQILPDGGHVSRNPHLLAELLLDLLPLRQAYAARGQEAPGELLNAIDRMIPMLRMFRHGDGSLALFNGMGVTAPETLATVLAYDDARGTAIANARHSGYQRLEAQSLVVIMDTGRPPPPVFSREAHAGCLAVEFSSGPHRIVVNCGAPDGSRVALRQAARATAAHSTLVVDDQSSCRIAIARGRHSWLAGKIVAGPVTVPVSRTEDSSGVSVTASHDGYGRRLGLVHERRVALAADGCRLDGEDRLMPWRQRPRTDANPPYVIRLHLHPSVSASRAGDNAALLSLPNGEAWVFEAVSGDMDLEESIFFAAPDGPRRTQQIAVRALARDLPAIIWSLTRVTV